MAGKKGGNRDRFTSKPGDVSVTPKKKPAPKPAPPPKKPPKK